MDWPGTTTWRGTAHVHRRIPLTSTDLATLTIGQRDELADLLDKIAWSVDHAGRSGELYPGEPRYQRAHEAGCWGWIADAYRRFTEAT